MNPQDQPQKAGDYIADRKVSSAPPVPRGLMSARPAMTNIRPQHPDDLARAQAAAAAKRAKQKSAEPPQLSPEELEERQTRLDYLKSIRGNEKPKKRWPKIVGIVLLVLILLGALGGGGYYWFVMKPEDTPAASSNQTADTQPQDTTPKQTETNTPVETKEYSSTNFPVTLKFPSNWTANDTPAKLTITSPSMDLTAADGSATKGAVVVTIRNKQTTLPEFAKGNATAVLTSENVAYSSPATGQRGSTYLSFLQYATTTTKGGLDAVYITGNSGYQKGQAIPQADVVKVDPLVTVSFVTCSTTCTDAGTATSISSSMWTGDFQKTIEDILKSLSIS